MHHHHAEERDETAAKAHSRREPPPAHPMLEWQQRIGNSALVQRMAQSEVEVQRAADEQRAAFDDAAKHPGQELAPGPLADLNDTTGDDHSHLRIHNDAAAHKAADKLGALAFTVGHDVYFGRGQFQPHTEQGKKTLRHEAGHALGVGGPPSGQVQENRLQVSDVDGADEKAAEAYAEGRHRPASVQRHADPGGPDSVQRMPSDKRKADDGEAGNKRQDTRKKLTLDQLKPMLLKALKDLGWTPHGGQQNRTVHKDPSGNNPDADSALGKAYAEDSASLRSARDFSDERPRQFLRWVSTVLFGWGEGKAREVQATIHDQQVVVSANVNAEIKKLADFVEGKTLRQVLDQVVETEGSGSGYRPRHRDKLKKRILGEEADQRYKDILPLLDKKVVVTDGGAEGEKAADDLHAERRLLKYVQAFGGSILDYQLTGGVKRPCVTCYLSLYQDQEDTTNGPFWPSAASNIDFEPYEKALAKTDDPEKAVRELAAKLNELDRTYVTVDKETGALVTSHDTDSGSSDSEDRSSGDERA